MKAVGPVATAFALAFLADLLLHIFQPLGDDFYLVSNVITILFSLLAVAFGFASCKLPDISNIRRRSMFFLTAGVFFWFLGEVTWSLYEILLGVKAPVVSIADVFWVTGYPLLTAGVYLIWKSTKIKLDGRKRLIFNLVPTASIFIFLFCLSFPTFTAVDLSLGEKVSTAGYIIGDAALLSAIITTMFHISGKELFKLWVAIFAAMSLIAIADVLYTYFLSAYASGHIIDVLWDLGYIILAFGFFNYTTKYRRILDTVFKNQD